MGATDIRPIAKGRLARWIDRITGKENGIGDLYSGHRAGGYTDLQ